MWRHWAHNGRKPGEKPRAWWHESRDQRRSDLPFGHLFPRIPGQSGGECARLVAEIRAEQEELARQRSGLEAIVTAYMQQAAPAPWEPVEAWQVVSIERLDAAETAEWGADGALVVEWFDRGDLATWPLGPPPAEPPERLGLAARIRARLQAWFGRPEGWEWATAGS